MNRRELLGLGTGVAITGLSGCLDFVASRTTRTASGPAVAYVPGTGQVPTTFDFQPPAVETTSITEVPLSVEGSVVGLSGSVDIDGWFTAGQLQANDFDSTRTNRTVADTSDDADGDGWARDAAAEYLADDPIVGEAFLLSLPNADPPGASEPMSEFSPRQLLDAVTAGDDGSRASGKKVVKFKPGAELSEKVKLASVGGGTVYKEIDKASPKIHGDSDGDGWGDAPPDEWPAETSVKGGTVSNTILAGATAGVENDSGSTVDLPALLHLKRIRHADDYLFYGGWVLDAGRVYDDAATLLVEASPNEVVGLSAGELDDDADNKATGQLARDRSGLGSLVYDGPATDDLLPFLPEALRDGEGLEQFAATAKRSARKGRNPQTGKEIKIPAKRVVRIGNTVAVIQAQADRCDREVCRTVGEHADGRLGLLRQARSDLEAGDTAAAREALREVREIVAGDVERLAAVEDRQAVGDLLGLERAAGRETDLALDPVDPDDDGDGISDGVEIAVERVEGEFAGDEDGDGVWDGIDQSLVDGSVATNALHVEGESVGTAHSLALKEGRKGMNAVNVQRTAISGGSYSGVVDEASTIRHWGVVETEDGEHRVVVTVVTDPDTGLAMNKAELIDSIASEADLADAHAGKSLDAFIDTTTKATAGIEKDQVKRGMVVAAPRLGGDDRNPQTGKEIKIPLVEDVGDDDRVLQTTVLSLDAPLVHLTDETKSLKKGNRVALVGIGSGD